MIFREAIDAIIGMHRQRSREREVRMQVAGQWVEGKGAQESAVVNPTTEQVLAWVRDASADIDYHGQPRMAQAGADESVRRLLQESRALGESVFGGHDRRASAA